MPALSVSVDGQLLATVSSEDGYNMLSLHVNCSRIDEEFATLNLAGGNYPEEGKSTYHVWIDHLLILPGQMITVAMHERAVTSTPGKPVDDLSPNEREKLFDPVDRPTLADVVAELKRRPNLRGQYTLQLAASNSPQPIKHAVPEDESLTFSVVWHELHRDDAARVSVHSGTLDGLLDRSPFNYHARLKLHAGESVSLQLGTLASP